MNQQKLLCSVLTPGAASHARKGFVIENKSLSSHKCPRDHTVACRKI